MTARIHVGTREPLHRPGGLHNYIRGLATAQRRMGFEVGALELIDHGGAFSAAADFDAVEIAGLGAEDLVEFHFAQTSSAILRRLPARVPRLFHFHGPWHAEGRVQGDSRWRVLAKRWIEARTYRRFDRFVAASGAFARVLIRDFGVPQDAVDVVYPGVDTERFVPLGTRAEARSRLGVAEGLTFACVRRLEPRMGISDAIDAIAGVPDAQLLICGSGSLREKLAAQIERLGVSHRVRLLGRVSDEELPWVYRAADATLVPTTALEGFGLVVLEAMASGSPVIATSVGGLPEAMGPFAAEWTVKPGRPELLRGALRRVAEGEAPSAREVRSYAETRSLATMAHQVEEIAEFLR